MMRIAKEFFDQIKGVDWIVIGVSAGVIVAIGLVIIVALRSRSAADV